MTSTLKKAPSADPHLRRRIAARLRTVISKHHWFCLDCQRPTERMEDDHGQPAFCGHADCGSHRLRLVRVEAEALA